MNVLKKLITTFSVYGKIQGSPQFELSNQDNFEVYKQAVFNVCENAERTDKKDILMEYLILSQSKIKKEIRDDFEEKYDLKHPTFYKWVKDLNDEIKRISRTEK